MRIMTEEGYMTRENIQLGLIIIVALVIGILWRVGGFSPLELPATASAALGWIFIILMFVLIGIFWYREKNK